jgi:HEAT repeat protein
MVLGVTVRTAFVRRALLPARPVRRSPWPATWAMLLVLGSGGLLAVGCDKVTSDNIALWKTTEKGPGKLAAALHDRSLEPKLRAEVAVALVDLGKPEEVETTLSALPANERWELMKTVVPALEAAMTGAVGPEKALGYRDALFSLRALASAEDQARIDAALLPGIEVALRSGRVPNGRHSVEKILLAVGAPAGGMLAKLLGEPIAGYAAVADLLARVGDESARAAGAASLVARAARQKPVPDATWKSLGVLGGPAAVKFLQDTIEHGDREDARSAVRALQQRREPQLLPLALRVAGDPGADPTVRDEMFGVIEVIGGPQSQAGLVHIIATDRQEIVRYRAFESLLVVGKANAIVAGLEAFPVGAPYKKGDVDDLLVKLIQKVGATAHPALLKALDSKIPLARMAAVMSLEHLGQPPDAAPLETLAKDTTMIKGFPSGETVGKEATRVAAALRRKG